MEDKEVKKDELVEVKKDELNAYQVQTIAKVYSLLRDIYGLSGNFGIALTGMQCLAKEGLMALKQAFRDVLKK